MSSQSSNDAMRSLRRYSSESSLEDDTAGLAEEIELRSEGDAKVFIEGWERAFEQCNGLGPRTIALTVILSPGAKPPCKDTLRTIHSRISRHSQLRLSVDNMDMFSLDVIPGPPDIWTSLTLLNVHIRSVHGLLSVLANLTGLVELDCSNVWFDDYTTPEPSEITIDKMEVDYPTQPPNFTIRLRDCHRLRMNQKDLLLVLYAVYHRRYSIFASWEARNFGKLLKSLEFTSVLGEAQSPGGVASFHAYGRESLRYDDSQIDVYLSPESEASTAVCTIKQDVSKLSSLDWETVAAAMTEISESFWLRLQIQYHDRGMYIEMRQQAVDWCKTHVTRPSANCTVELRLCAPRDSDDSYDLESFSVEMRKIPAGERMEEAWSWWYADGGSDAEECFQD